MGSGRPATGQPSNAVRECDLKGPRQTYAGGAHRQRAKAGW